MRGACPICGKWFKDVEFHELNCGDLDDLKDLSEEAMRRVRQRGVDRILGLERANKDAERAT